MIVTRLADAKPYEAPKHVDCIALRLHGFDASPVEGFSVGLSHFLPGGGVERDATPLEKVYVVTEGEVTIVTDEGEATLGPYDSMLPGAERGPRDRESDQPAGLDDHRRAVPAVGMSVARPRLAPRGTMFPPRTPFFQRRMSMGEPPGSPMPLPHAHRAEVAL